MLFYNARWLDTNTGRFTQPDTLIPNPSDTQAYDRYDYVNNNPVNGNDPSGHCTDPDENCPLKSTSTPPYQATSTPPPGYFNNSGLPQLPQSQVTPTPGTSINPVPAQSTILGSSDQTPGFSLKINVDWTKVDKIDIGIDTIGVIASVAEAIGLIPAPGASAGTAYVNAAIQGAGLVKSGFELVNGDTNGALFQETNDTGQKVILMVARTERIAPIVGVIGNIVSLGYDFRNANLSVNINWSK